MNLKEQFIKKLEQRKVDYEGKINILKAKADRAEAELKIKYYEEIENLRLKQKAAWEKLDGIKSAGEGAFQELKIGVEKAWDDLKTSIEAAVEKFK